MQCVQFTNRSTTTDPGQVSRSLFSKVTLPCAQTSVQKGREGELLVQQLTAGGFLIRQYHLVATAETTIQSRISRQGFFLTYVLKAPSPVLLLPDTRFSENEYHLIYLHPGPYEWRIQEGTYIVLQIYITASILQSLHGDFPDLAKAMSDMLTSHKSILSPKPNRITYTARQCIHQIMSCRFTGNAADTYLTIKARELVFDFAGSFQSAMLLPDADREDLELLDEIEQYISSHLNKSITSQTIMHVFSISEYRLKKLFKLKQTSPAEFIAQTRMEKALTLLKHTTDKITAIGREVGYQNASWFADAFFKYHGLKPSEVRNNTRKPGIHSPDPGMKK
jgi:AraC-like DNA-binding protein